MPRPIEHRASFDAPAETLYGVLTDRAYLEARLAELGGKDPALTELQVDGSTARVGLRSSVPVEFLPSLVQRFTGGDLVLDRVETWDAAGSDAAGSDGTAHGGTVEVTVRGLPGRITGRHALRDADGGCAYELRGEAEVSVPMVSGKIESVVVEQVSALLDSEDDFTRRWLAEH